MAWIEQNHGVTCRGFERFPAEFVRRIANAVGDAKARAGDTPALKFIGTHNGRYKFAYDKVYEDHMKQCADMGVTGRQAENWSKQETERYLRYAGIRRSRRGVYGVCYYTPNDRYGLNGVCLDPSLFNKGADRAREVRDGFKAKGCEDPISTVYHELGHALDHAFGLRSFSMLGGARLTNAVLDNVWRTQDVENGLSGYGASKSAEMIAEGWAEYKMNPEPRQIAKTIGEEIDRLARTRRDGNA